MAVEFVPRSSALKVLWAGAQFNPWVRGAVAAGTAAYLGYEAYNKGLLDPYLPDGLDKFPDIPTLPLPPSPAPTPTKTSPVVPNPSVKAPIDELKEKMNENTRIANTNFQNIENKINSAVDSFSTANTSLVDAVSHSPLLMHQAMTKDTLDSIAISLEKQNLIFTNLTDVFISYFDSFLNVQILDVQNNKVITDYQKKMASSGDYGDADYFYAFESTSVYWHKVDLAQYVFDERLGITTNSDLLPSVMYMEGEISLIDRLEETSTKKEIRDAVESYRKSKVPSGVRALIDFALVKGTESEKEATKEASTYYKAATENLSNDVSGVSLSKIAGWADMAIEREKIIQTPTTIKDMDGTVIAENVSPLSISITKDASIAREKTDINSQEFDDDDFNNPFDVIPTIPFISSSDIYNPKHQAPTSNSFLEIMKTKFTGLFS
ncbi:hypothetical protein Sulku_1337 [Sulfuricurvum kujiense DSM 16994]|uniref:Uncharacterized protein n=1 Tax=Sulfuricurvum kujiense (strain ATCC BAA-921 / DSM 16994 / JCM 11577 / YK-1) TaxID=709032 RepID=E4TY80_SULKY|nr:hypothetical protein [Sulfuricurvum kujiense]ADR34000.1 hypothetical protein Sulku_1337 [Sulfuricurvum kujiense DSM 16994]